MNNPQKDDAILGGSNRALTSAAILGGLTGVKTRLANAPKLQRIQLLTQALGYGNAGLDFLIQELQNSSVDIAWDVCAVLSGSTESKALEALQQHSLYRFFRCDRVLVSDPTYAIAIAPNGEFLVSGDNSKTLSLWNLKTGVCIKTLPFVSGFLRGISCVAITADSKFVVSGTYYHTVEAWDIETEQKINSPATLSSYIGSVIVSPTVHRSKRWVIAGVGNDIEVWADYLYCGSKLSLRTYEGHTGSVDAIAITPDGKKLVSGSADKTIRIWNLPEGNLEGILEGHLGEVNSVAIFPDGNTIVSSSRDRTVKVWDIKTQQCTHILEGHLGEVNSVAIFPGGSAIVSGSDDATVKIWNLKTGQCITTLEGHTKKVLSVAIAPDGKTIASAGLDGNIRLWTLGDRD